MFFWHLHKTIADCDRFRCMSQKVMELIENVKKKIEDGFVRFIHIVNDSSLKTLPKSIKLDDNK